MGREHYFERLVSFWLAFMRLVKAQVDPGFNWRPIPPYSQLHESGHVCVWRHQLGTEAFQWCGRVPLRHTDLDSHDLLRHLTNDTNVPSELYVRRVFVCLRWIWWNETKWSIQSKGWTEFESSTFPRLNVQSFTEWQLVEQRSILTDKRCWNERGIKAAQSANVLPDWSQLEWIVEHLREG